MALKHSSGTIYVQCAVLHFYFISLLTGKMFHWYCKKTWYLMNDENHCLQSNCDLVEFPFFSDPADIVLFSKWLYIVIFFIVIFWVSLFNFSLATMPLQGLTSAIYTFRLVLALELHPHQAYPHLVLILPALLSGSEAYPSTINIICYGIVMHLYHCFQLIKQSKLPQNLSLTAAPPTLSDSLICWLYRVPPDACRCILSGFPVPLAGLIVGKLPPFPKLPLTPDPQDKRNNVDTSNSGIE